ncbi:MAG: acetoin utilization protein [Hyphomicrobiales bacterium]|nr:MAG: acetoin utilization protein [Hyphomicrobiales bacterium]
MPTQLYQHEAFLNHKTPIGHPERPDRIRALMDVLADPHFDALAKMEAPMGDVDKVLYAHPLSHLNMIRSAIPDEGIRRLDNDTVMSPGSWEASLRGIGAATAAIDAVMSGEADNAFCAIRPPGHHAEKTTAMGFCLFNTIAIAARHAQKIHGVERVVIVDFDVHHGNGSQDIFWDDPSVMYCSTHQMPLFPGSGALIEEGEHGNIINAPLAMGDDIQHFQEAFESRIFPAIDNFAPDLILISAGFDAHQRDPLAQINLQAEDFAWVTSKLLEKADKHCGARMVSLLEGGYDLLGLAESAAAHINTMMDASS